MLRKWKILAPLALTAAGAIAAGVATLMQKTQSKGSAAGGDGTAAPAAGRQLAGGSYSFISGYQDPATVELTLKFDPELLSFAVMEEEFLSYSSASHVAVVYGEDFNAQIEYAPYYAGEDFAGLTAHVKEKYGSVLPARYAALDGIRYRDGDAVCLCFPIPGDAHSYIQVTLLKLKEDDKPLEELPEHPLVRALLDSVRIEVRK